MKYNVVQYNVVPCNTLQGTTVMIDILTSAKSELLKKTLQFKLLGSTVFLN